MSDSSPGDEVPGVAPVTPSRFPLGSILLALFLGMAMAAYALSVFEHARRVTDWLLIVPVAVLGIATLAVAALDDWRQGRLGRAPARGEGDGKIGAALVVLVLAYVGSIPWVGFDVATAIFIALALVLQGERRLKVVLPVSLLTAGLLVWLFRHVMGIPVPSSLI